MSARRLWSWLRERLAWILLGIAGPAVECMLMTADLSSADDSHALLKTVTLLVTPVLLFAAHRFPLPVFLATLPSVYAGASVPPLAALYAVSLHGRRRWVPVVCAMVFVYCEQHSAEYPRMSIGSLEDIARTTAYGMACIAPVVLGMLTRIRGELSARLVELEASRVREGELLTQQVLASERARLAREMHDVIAHQVSLISVQSAALQVSTTDPRVQESARTVRELAATTLGELRQMLGVLRASGSTVDVRAPQPRLADLPQLIADSGLDAEFRTEVSLVGAGASAWSPTVQRAAFRTVQEGLTNASKHAPGAPIDVHLCETGRHLHVKVRNAAPPPEAQPLDLPTSGFGLTGLCERAHLAGGRVQAGRTEDGGYLLHAVYPPPHVPATTD
ncbi:sensor histidine kinase [Streptomyces sp. NPDC058655]|uniref:sensor histidine kinase n=1 Tax=Streptomyces sp. NPDC058655 TaxID=3346577 RepID=UPI003649569A